MPKDFDRVEDVLMNHRHRNPICWNLIRLNDSILFEHETKLPNGKALLIIYRYDSKRGLTINKIFDKEGFFKDITEEYANHPNVVSVMLLINEETKDLQLAEIRAKRNTE